MPLLLLVARRTPLAVRRSPYAARRENIYFGFCICPFVREGEGEGERVVHYLVLDQ